MPLVHGGDSALSAAVSTLGCTFACALIALYLYRGSCASRGSPCPPSSPRVYFRPFYFCALRQGHGITWWRPSGVTDTRRVSEAVGSDTVAWMHGPSSPVRWWRDSPTFKCADASLWIHLEINARGNKDPRPGSSAAARSRIITSSSRVSGARANTIQSRPPTWRGAVRLAGTRRRNKIG